MAGAASPHGGRLHGVSLSPFVRKVRAVLAIKGIDYELVNVMPGAVTPEFVAISPMRKIPVWEEGDWSVPDSSAIAAYLERAVPSPSILPEDPRRFARDLFWEEYGDTRLVQASGPIFFQRIVRAKVFKEAPDEEVVRRHGEEHLPPVFDQLEALLLDDVDPERPTLGALSIWSPIVNLDHAGHGLDRDRWPGLAAFLDRLGAHPALAALVEEERAALASF